MLGDLTFIINHIYYTMSLDFNEPAVMNFNIILRPVTQLFIQRKIFHLA